MVDGLYVYSVHMFGFFKVMSLTLNLKNRQLFIHAQEPVGISLELRT